MSGLSAHAGVGFSVSLNPRISENPLFRREVRGLSAFQDRALLPWGATVSHNSVVNLETMEVVHTSFAGGTLISNPYIMTYQGYKQAKLREDVRKTLREDFEKGYLPGTQAAGGEGIAIDVPFRIKSKAFRRIFGGDNIGLRVSGNITIDGNVRQQKFGKIQSATQRDANTSFQIDMIQRFSITGKVGEKVEVKVDQDSERLFDFENSIMLTYTGNENEIIKKIEAGNVNLSLSGPRHATISKQNKGLFGLKTEMQLGALNVTGIASLERGQKNKLNPSTDAAKRPTFNELAILRDQYFWLSKEDIDGQGRAIPNYRDQYRRYDQERKHTVPFGQPEIQGVDVYISTSNVPKNENVLFGTAVALKYDDVFTGGRDSSTVPDKDIYQGTWKKLTSGQFSFDANLGYIRLEQKMTEAEHIACAFYLSDGTTFGSYNNPDAQNLQLIMLRTSTPDVTDDTWDLMFRHVYSLDAQGIKPDDFKLEIIRETPATYDETGLPGTTTSYLTFFGFDEQSDAGGSVPDGRIDNISTDPPLIDYVHGEIHFLDLTPFDPSGYWKGDLFIQWPLDSLDNLESMENYGAGFLNEDLYIKKQSVLSSGGAKWKFRAEFKGTTSLFELGPLVLEGSEEVYLNGAQMQRGVDYTIDYLSGRLQIINPAAKAEGANLDITYESGRVFQLDKKTLLGVRAEYGLWGDANEKSYIGGMMLYLNEQTMDRRVRVGNEPIRNTLYDMNAVLNFKPKFLTPAVNMLPLVHSEVGSRFTLEGEVAKVFPNPNSLSNDATGDTDGLAFLDDFEGSRRAVPLGMMRRNWSIASIPEDDEIEMRRGRFRWWNPPSDLQVEVKDVYPERETNNDVAERLQSLILELEPDSNGVRSRSWGGVMRYLGDGFADQTNAQFLEFWIQMPSNPEGRLVIDLGTISEDALPDGSMSTEDRPVPGTDMDNINRLREYGNDALDGGEDTGIDGMDRDDPQDTARWNGPNYPPIPSWDDYGYSSGGSDFEKINGQEGNGGNGGDDGGDRPDTEDLNNNNILDLENNYFSYNVELSNDSKYIAGGFNNQKRWRLFRIPLNPPNDGTLRVVGAPSITDIRWARIYMTGMSRETKLQFVQMDIVSNEWLPEELVGDSTEAITVTVINNHENPLYESPPGVQGEIDPITNLRQREQSLVLRIDSLTSVLPEFYVAKNLFQELNLIQYRQLKMFVHGGGVNQAGFRDGLYELVLRMGKSYANIHSDYYEIVQTIKPGWDEDNTINIALDSLSILHKYRSDSVSAYNYRIKNTDTTRTNPRGLPDLLTETMRYAYAPDSTQPTDSIVVMGRPSLQNVGFIALGVRAIRDEDGYIPNPWSGPEPPEIWVDELRLSSIHKDPGIAAEIRGKLDLADFATLTGSVSRLDADFHNVDQRTSSSGLSGLEDKESFLGNISMKLDKFYLEKWGVQLPLSMNYTESIGTPKFIPNTDVRVDRDNAPDSLKSFARNVTYTTSFSKAKQSPNPLVSWTIERIRLDWDHSYNKSNSFRAGRSVRKTTGASGNYEFPTAKGRGIAPIWWIRPVPVLSLLGSPRIYFKPRTLRLGLTADESEDVSRTQQRQTTIRRAFSMTQSLTTGFDPFEPLTLDFSRNHTTIHRSDSLAKKGWSELLSGDLGRLTNASQTSSARYSPSYASWFQPNFSYTGNYTWSHLNLDSESGETMSNGRTLGADVSLDFRSILGGGGERRGGGGRSPDRTPERDPESGEEEGAEGDSTIAEPKKPPVSFKKRLAFVLFPFKTAMSVLDPVTLSYGNTLQHSAQGTLGQAIGAYQLGLVQDPGVNTVADYVSVPNFRKGNTYTARTGIRITRTISTSMDYDWRRDETKQTQIRQTTEQTRLWIGSKKDTPVYPFLDLTVNWSGLEQLSFLQGLTESVSLNSAVSSSMTEEKSSKTTDSTGVRRLELDSRDYTRQWSPLLGVDIGWKGGFDSNIRYNRDDQFREGMRPAGLSRSTNSSASATLSYSIRRGFRLPLLFMSAIRLENQTTFSLNFEHSTRSTETAGDNGIYAPREKSTSWSLQPQMTYSFSNTVQGRAHVMMQQTKDEITTNKTKLFEFGIQVQIAIRG